MNRQPGSITTISSGNNSSSNSSYYYYYHSMSSSSSEQQQQQQSNAMNSSNSSRQAVRRSSRVTRRSFSSDATLDELRLSRRISDGGSVFISDSMKALAFTHHRGESISATGRETYIASLVDDMRSSIRDLGGTPTNAQLERWAVLVHECLSIETRKFHSVHHVFEISARGDAVELLGAFFRDTINLVLDGGLSKRQESLLQGIIVDGPERGQRALTSNLDDQEPQVRMIFDIFAVTPGQPLEGEGSDPILISVFLSSILMCRVFQDTLSITVIAQIVTAMEATIPFRPVDSEGRTSLDRLHGRLKVAVTKYELDMDEEGIVQAIQRAADLGNRNLGNFANPDAATFLDHTFALLPERSAALRRSHLYTVTDFLLAAHDMVEFLRILEPSVIFHSFHGVPSEDEMETFSDQSILNIQKGRSYLKARLVRTAVISAFATLTGGDAPLSFFAGDLPGRSHESRQLGEDFPCPSIYEIERYGSGGQPQKTSSAKTVHGWKRHFGFNAEVYSILKSGRHLEQSFDTRSEPLAAYLYLHLGDQGIEEAIDHCTFPMTDESSRELLKFIPQSITIKIGEDIGRIAVSRTDGIRDLLEEMFGPDFAREKNFVDER